MERAGVCFIVSRRRPAFADLHPGHGLLIYTEGVGRCAVLVCSIQPGGTVLNVSVLINYPGIRERSLRFQHI